MKYILVFSLLTLAIATSATDYEITLQPNPVWGEDAAVNHLAVIPPVEQSRLGVSGQVSDAAAKESTLEVVPDPQAKAPGVITAVPDAEKHVVDERLSSRGIGYDSRNQEEEDKSQVPHRRPRLREWS